MKTPIWIWRPWWHAEANRTQTDETSRVRIGKQRIYTHPRYIVAFACLCLDHGKAGRINPKAYLLCHCQHHLCQPLWLAFHGSTPSLWDSSGRALCNLRPLCPPAYDYSHSEALLEWRRSFKGQEQAVSFGLACYLDRMQSSAEISLDYIPEHHRPGNPILLCSKL